ncbi:M48 family metallopeptidase [Luteimonas sp. RD2P54]|uniref:M48 family metallopeptidase n=1 Tax=Luteimonas endophytica TaxID=3042023 RepID=A0ABT6J7Z9_9GAMM|nr:M48 family metallopeptidase [Luteimonas endophytica]MDH5822945.1 M48 family metallopeptidase [Luteimonas endophytica]
MLLFALAVIGIVVTVNLVVLAFAGPRPGTLLLATAATVAVIGLGSLYRISTLGAGGEAVAMQLGGVAVAEDTVDPQLRRLRNVVEEMSIASGVPVPKVYVLEHEAGINAFAAGYSPSDAAVAVTRGALDRLNRDELQGVVAHEFSHVLNGDMRLNIRLMGILFGILMLGLIGRKILMHSYGIRGRGALGILGAAIVALVIGYVGVFFGRMIKAGVSRSREVLADASAVQFTRQSSGLAGALKKIAGLREGSQLEQRGDAEEVSHMLFGDGVGLRGLFATHPPILQRIQALDPSFRPEQVQRLRAQWLAAPPNGLEEDVQLGLAARDHGALPGATAEMDLTPPMVSAQVAHPRDDDYRRADALVAAMPEALRVLARERENVMPLLLALLLDGDGEVRRRQHQEISARLGARAADRAAHLRQTGLQDLHPMQRLPLASLAFPVLRLRPRSDLDAFLDTVHAVVHADDQVSLFEYCLGTLLETQVRETLDPARHARTGRGKPGSVKQEFSTLLAVVAQAGHADPAEAKRAYLAGLQRVLPRDHMPYEPPAHGVRALDAVWEPLDRLAPLAKQVMVEAVTAAAMHDGRVSVAEAELLRTICGVLHCPLPPMLDRG